ncbi:hypothetical protein SDDV_ORF111 [Scale drop disease virus]
MYFFRMYLLTKQMEINPIVTEWFDNGQTCFNWIKDVSKVKPMQNCVFSALDDNNVSSFVLPSSYSHNKVNENDGDKLCSNYQAHVFQSPANIRVSDDMMVCTDVPLSRPPIMPKPSPIQYMFSYPDTTLNTPMFLSHNLANTEDDIYIITYINEQLAFFSKLMDRIEFKFKRYFEQQMINVFKWWKFNDNSKPTELRARQQTVLENTVNSKTTTEQFISAFITAVDANYTISKQVVDNINTVTDGVKINLRRDVRNISDNIYSSFLPRLATYTDNKQLSEVVDGLKGDVNAEKVKIDMLITKHFTKIQEQVTLAYLDTKNKYTKINNELLALDSVFNSLQAKQTQYQNRLTSLNTNLQDISEKHDILNHRLQAIIGCLSKGSVNSLLENDAANYKKTTNNAYQIGSIKYTSRLSLMQIDNITTTQAIFNPLSVVMAKPIKANQQYLLESKLYFDYIFYKQDGTSVTNKGYNRYKISILANNNPIDIFRHHVEDGNFISIYYVYTVADMLRTRFKIQIEFETDDDEEQYHKIILLPSSQKSYFSVITV